MGLTVSTLKTSVFSIMLYKKRRYYTGLSGKSMSSVLVKVSFHAYESFEFLYLPKNAVVPSSHTGHSNNVGAG